MRQLITIVFLFSFFADTAVSEIKNYPLDCTKNLQNLLSFVETISADFKQINYTEKNAITQKAYGYLVAKIFSSVRSAASPSNNGAKAEATADREPSIGTLYKTAPNA